MLDTGSIAATSVQGSEDAQGLLHAFNEILTVISSKPEKGKEKELEWDVRSRFSQYTRDDVWWLLSEEPKKAMLMHSAAMHPKVTKYFLLSHYPSSRHQLTPLQQGFSYLRHFTQDLNPHDSMLIALILLRPHPHVEIYPELCKFIDKAMLLIPAISHRLVRNHLHLLSHCNAFTNSSLPTISRIFRQIVALDSADAVPVALALLRSRGGFPNNKPSTNTEDPPPLSAEHLAELEGDPTDDKNPATAKDVVALLLLTVRTQPQCTFLMLQVFAGRYRNMPELEPEDTEKIAAAVADALITVDFANDAEARLALQSMDFLFDTDTPTHILRNLRERHAAASNYLMAFEACMHSFQDHKSLANHPEVCVHHPPGKIISRIRYSPGEFRTDTPEELAKALVHYHPFAPSTPHLCPKLLM